MLSSVPSSLLSVEKAHILRCSSTPCILQGQALVGLTSEVKCQQTCLPSRPQPYCPVSVVVVIKVIFVSPSVTLLCLSLNSFFYQSRNRKQMAHSNQNNSAHLIKRLFTKVWAGSRGEKQDSTAAEGSQQQSCYYSQA